MKTFKNITKATEAAETFFNENFDYKNGVGIEKQIGNQFEFYSKDDPAMDDTFTCLIEE